MLYGQVAVVDVATPGNVGAARQAVDQRCEFGIWQLDTGKDVIGGFVEKAAVVWWQADRVLALVDRAEQVAQVPPRARCGGTEGVAFVHAPREIVTQPA